MLMYDNVLSSSANYHINNSTTDRFELPYENLSHARRPDDKVSTASRHNEQEIKKSSFFSI